MYWYWIMTSRLLTRSFGLLGAAMGPLALGAAIAAGALFLFAKKGDAIKPGLDKMAQGTDHVKDAEKRLRSTGQCSICTADDQQAAS